MEVNWSLLRSGRVTRGECAHGTHWRRGWSGLGGEEKKNSCLCMQLSLGRLARKSVSILTELPQLLWTAPLITLIKCIVLNC